jgi:hypothetical protein
MRHADGGFRLVFRKIEEHGHQVAYRFRLVEVGRHLVLPDSTNQFSSGVSSFAETPE